MGKLGTVKKKHIVQLLFISYVTVAIIILLIKSKTKQLERDLIYLPQVLFTYTNN